MIGIDVDADAVNTRSTVLRIARSTAARVDAGREISEEDVQIAADYAGDSYGLPSPQTIEAIRLMGRLEGVLLDPVYEGKAMAGLIDKIRHQQFASSNRILFLHLGGAPALHAYADLFAHRETLDQFIGADQASVIVVVDPSASEIRSSEPMITT